MKCICISLQTYNLIYVRDVGECNATYTYISYNYIGHGLMACHIIISGRIPSGTISKESYKTIIYKYVYSISLGSSTE